MVDLVAPARFATSGDVMYLRQQLRHVATWIKIVCRPRRVVRTHTTDSPPIPRNNMWAPRAKKRDPSQGRPNAAYITRCNSHTYARERRAGSLNSLCLTRSTHALNTWRAAQANSTLTLKLAEQLKNNKIYKLSTKLLKNTYFPYLFSFLLLFLRSRDLKCIQNIFVKKQC